jgi:hypothetical protein
MKLDNLEKASDSQFRRITGVKRKTFEKMVEILQAAEVVQKAKGGRPNKLSMPTRLLMTLEYIREYRTYAHIGMSYGLGESNAFAAIRWIENILIQSKEFRLPGKKTLSRNENQYEVILIDATESPIERPKKNNVYSILARKNDIQ